MVTDKYVYANCSVTSYPIKDDAFKTGELDYINGGMYQIIINI